MRRFSSAKRKRSSSIGGRRRYVSRKRYNRFRARLYRAISRRYGRAEVKHKDTYQQLTSYIATADSGFIVTLNEDIQQGITGASRLGDKIRWKGLYVRVYVSWGGLPESEILNHDKINTFRIIIFLYWNRDNVPTIHDYRTGLLDRDMGAVDHGIALYQWNRQYRYRILYDKVKRVFPYNGSNKTFSFNRRFNRTIEYNYLNKPDLNVGLAIIGGSIAPLDPNSWPAYAYCTRFTFTDA